MKLSATKILTLALSVWLLQSSKTEADFVGWQNGGYAGSVTGPPVYSTDILWGLFDFQVRPVAGYGSGSYGGVQGSYGLEFALVNDLGDEVSAGITNTSASVGFAAGPFVGGATYFDQPFGINDGGVIAPIIPNGSVHVGLRPSPEPDRPAPGVSAPEGHEQFPGTANYPDLLEELERLQSEPSTGSSDVTTDFQADLEEMLGIAPEGSSMTETEATPSSSDSPLIPILEELEIDEPAGAVPSPDSPLTPILEELEVEDPAGAQPSSDSPLTPILEELEVGGGDGAQQPTNEPGAAGDLAQSDTSNGIDEETGSGSESAQPSSSKPTSQGDRSPSQSKSQTMVALSGPAYMFPFEAMRTPVPHRAAAYVMKGSKGQLLETWSPSSSDSNRRVGRRMAKVRILDGPDAGATGWFAFSSLEILRENAK